MEETIFSESPVDKIIAIITMFCDHFGDFYFGSTTVLNYIGRFAFPIFAFQASIGFDHTKNFKKYIKHIKTRIPINPFTERPFLLFSVVLEIEIIIK